MTDDDAARLRALATASLSTVKGRFDLAMEGDAILALLDALDEARRERDEAKRVIDDAYAALGGDANRPRSVPPKRLGRQRCDDR